MINSDVLKLREKFHLFQNQETALAAVRRSADAYYEFLSMDQEYRDQILQFFTGEMGVKLTYDTFFKRIFRPDICPERLEGLLGALLGEAVQVKGVLPNEGFRFSEKASLVVMDILVELSDGSLVNVEIQKIPYAFPGQRCACYSADLVLRQYARVKSERGKSFTYGDIKNVYTVVLMEKSIRGIRGLSGQYIHRAEQRFDTGIRLPMVQKYVIVSLDSYREQKHGLETELDAWLHLLTDESPGTILQIVEKYPKFEAIYRDVFEFMRKPEEVIHMFSEELRILDENTIHYMIEKQKEELDAVNQELDAVNQELDAVNQELNAANQELNAANKELDAANRERDAAYKRLASAEQEKEQSVKRMQEENARLEERIRELERLLAKND